MASEEFVLYSYPASFSSQKVLLTLLLKNAKFRTVNVDIKNHEQTEPWYMELNPAGEVPTLKHGDVVKNESDDIIDYINSKVQEPNLIPEPNSKKGKEICKWRQYLHHINPELIAMGILMYPELSIRGDELPLQITQQEYQKKAEEKITMLKEKAEQNPKLSSAYLKKVETAEKRLNNYYSKESTMKELDRLEEVFDFVEQQIKRAREACFAEETDFDVFMFGREITVVDITVGVLMNLLCALKVESRYIGRKKRRLLFKYWENFKEVPSMKKIQGH